VRETNQQLEKHRTKKTQTAAIFCRQQRISSYEKTMLPLSFFELGSFLWASFFDLEIKSYKMIEAFTCTLFQLSSKLANRSRSTTNQQRDIRNH
jgi:hypothetical protein